MYYTRAIESGDLPHPDLFFAFNNRGNAYASKRDYDLRFGTTPRRFD